MTNQPLEDEFDLFYHYESYLLSGHGSFCKLVRYDQDESKRITQEDQTKDRNDQDVTSREEKRGNQNEEAHTGVCLSYTPEDQEDKTTAEGHAVQTHDRVLYARGIRRTHGSNTQPCVENSHDQKKARLRGTIVRGKETSSKLYPPQTHGWVCWACTTINCASNDIFFRVLKRLLVFRRL